MSSDLEDLRALVADVLGRQPDADSGELWRTLASLGLTTIGIPEEAGGAGGGLPELIAVVAELAERGADVPLVEFNTGRWALGSRAGSIPGEVAIGCARKTGEVVRVGWAAVATHLVLLVDDAPSAGLVALDAPGVTVRDGHDPVDGHGARVELDGADVTDLRGEPDGDAIRVRLGLLRCAALVGATRGAYRMTRRYVREREQFGRPLVRIPAVASALARMRVEVIQSEVALERAVEAGTLEAVAVARVIAGEAASATADAAHQLHGAMGITQEYGLHRLTRKLWCWRDADLPEAAWARRLGAAAASDGEDVVWTVLTATV
ncbi:acyl-CoA dehydrogenase family protein [Amycolatopsis thermoflava]|uniref:acyl-CoA dehydrogenase family protein n=1 Tax=Amycolatopsis thermoflava TaxID=84480 RepID=UPI00380292C4